MGLWTDKASCLADPRQNKKHWSQANRRLELAGSKPNRSACPRLPYFGRNEAGMSEVKWRSAVAIRIVAGSDRVSLPALRIETSLSSPTPPSTVWRASPCPDSPNVRAKSSAASACRSGVPDRAAIMHSTSIVKCHIAPIFQCARGFCQFSRYEMRLSDTLPACTDQSLFRLK
jgi:hypothetical protein